MSDTGVDCTVVLIRPDHALPPENGEEPRLWEPFGFVHLDRNSRLFDWIQRHATPGYPPNSPSSVKAILTETEVWGECWMEWSEFESKARKNKVYLPFKKSALNGARLVFRFDN